MVKTCSQFHLEPIVLRSESPGGANINGMLVEQAFFNHTQPVENGTEEWGSCLTNGKHNDESNSTGFSKAFQEFSQQPNEGEGNSGLLPFTQHFSLCQEFLKCHRNIIHMLHRLWTIFSKPPPRTYPAAPKLHIIWAWQQMACTPTVPPFKCTRGLEERAPGGSCPQRKYTQRCCGWVTASSYAKIFEKLGASYGSH